MFVCLAMSVVAKDDFVEEGCKSLIALMTAGITSDARVSVLTT
jgi:hypothetical protein